MNETLSKSKAIRLVIWTIVVHALFSSLHGAAHQYLGVRLSSLQVLYVAVVITIAPILAGVLLWKGFFKIGASLFVSSMTGSLIFGVYNHFIGISPDHVSHLEVTTITNWVWIFQATAALIAVIETYGVWLGVRLLRSSQTTSTLE